MGGGLSHFARTVPMERRKDRRRAGWTTRTRPYSRVRYRCAAQVLVQVPVSRTGEIFTIPP
ncbi:unnamed protein product [Tuber melanosporum]|uniref:(Perigord truffle) hypothetical protein n=1 Tax=Tuber melanosporum (strain Mel28) TaxID=656061 RepID=D5GIK6_TUBMM|nr:uncharacterized protein GSTUM_00008540001 [Tuber melanosporum]CAZ84349.1 unnamed protein product [Tuber melanosporum]